MKQTINESGFILAFRDFGRYDQFGYEALCKLFEYYEEIEDATGEQIELDVLAICCDWTVSTPDEIIQDYGLSVGYDDDEEKATAVLDYLEGKTTAFLLDNGNILYLAF